MSLSLQIAGNTLAQLIAKLITSAVTFFITIIIARQYGAAGYGEFTKIITYVVIFYLFIDFGLNAVFLRAVRKESAALPFTALLSIRVVMGIGLIFIALAVLAFLPYYSGSNDGFPPSVKLGIILLSPTILALGIQTSCNALFQSKLRYDQAAIASILGSITTASCVVLLSYINASIPLLMLSYVGGSIVTVCAAYLLLRPFIHVQKNISWLHEFAAGKKLFILAVPLGLTIVLSAIHFRADIFILTLYRSTPEVGIYGLASKFFEFALTIPAFFMNAVYPVLLTAIADHKKSLQLMKKAAIFLGVISVIIAILGYVGAPFLSIIKDDFVDSIKPFQIFMLFLPFFYLSSVLMWYLIAREKNWQLVWIYLTGAVCNIVLNILFIPRYGVMAAALTTGVSEVLLLVLLAHSALPLLRQKYT